MVCITRVYSTHQIFRLYQPKITQSYLVFTPARCILISYLYIHICMKCSKSVTVYVANARPVLTPFEPSIERPQSVLHATPLTRSAAAMNGAVAWPYPHSATTRRTCCGRPERSFLPGTGAAGVALPFGLPGMIRCVREC